MLRAAMLSPGVKSIVLLLCCTAFPLLAAAGENHCIPIDKAGDHVGKKACIVAHVYDVAEIKGGTRFLDVCAPNVSDAECKFFVVSFPADRKDVGDLTALKGSDIQIRGTLHNYEGRTTIVLSLKRQLHGGDEKFEPNTQLAGSSFSALSSDKPFDDHDRAGDHFSHVSALHTGKRDQMEIDNPNGAIASGGTSSGSSSGSSSSGAQSSVTSKSK
jgi:hypothetical protein